MNGHPAAFAAGFALFIGGLVSAIGDALGFVAVVTAACAGGGRYSAVLLRRDQAQIERVTAWGFFLGVLFSSALLVIERF